MCVGPFVVCHGVRDQHGVLRVILMGYALSIWGIFSKKPLCSWYFTGYNYLVSIVCNSIVFMMPFLIYFSFSNL